MPSIANRAESSTRGRSFWVVRTGQSAARLFLLYRAVGGIVTFWHKNDSSTLRGLSVENWWLPSPPFPDGSGELGRRQGSTPSPASRLRPGPRPASPGGAGYEARRKEPAIGRSGARASAPRDERPVDVGPCGKLDRRARSRGMKRSRSRGPRGMKRSRLGDETVALEG